MATNQKGLTGSGFSTATRRVALAVAAITAAACSTMPTGPDTKMRDWEGEPVVTTAQNCGAAGCAVRATTPTP